MKTHASTKHRALVLEPDVLHAMIVLVGSHESEQLVDHFGCEELRLD